MGVAQNDLAASLDRLGACLPLAGTDRFLEPFLAALQAIGATQCMVFSYGDGRVRCLLARNFVARPKGQNTYPAIRKQATPHGIVTIRTNEISPAITPSRTSG